MAKKTILCAIDFSESSLSALQWAMSLAHTCQAQVTVLFCYRLISGSNEGELQYMKRDMEAKALDRFHELEKKLDSSNTVSYQFVMEVGFFPFRIEMFIRKSDVNLLVMGNSVMENFTEHKTLNFDQFLLKSRIPVVVVPAETHGIFGTANGG